tara:strand:- start:7688 stop:7858 length:171 start_codon:yes stop_codon:yes gene_type:complete
MNKYYILLILLGVIALILLLSKGDSFQAIALIVMFFLGQLFYKLKLGDTNGHEHKK